MKRVAKCWVVLGADHSFLTRPHYWKEHAEAEAPKGCVVVAAKIVLDDKPSRKQKR